MGRVREHGRRANASPKILISRADSGQKDNLAVRRVAGQRYSRIIQGNHLLRYMLKSIEQKFEVGVRRRAYVRLASIFYII